jgi:hypothetical protein
MVLKDDACWLEGSRDKVDPLFLFALIDNKPSRLMTDWRSAGCIS